MPDSSPASGPEPIAGTGLQLRRNATRGFVIGGLVAAAVFVVFVLLPGTTRPTGLYVGLAFVLGVSIGLLVTIMLVGWRVRRLARTL